MDRLNVERHFGPRIRVEVQGVTDERATVQQQTNGIALWAIGLRSGGEGRWWRWGWRRPLGGGLEQGALVGTMWRLVALALAAASAAHAARPRQILVNIIGQGMISGKEVALTRTQRALLYLGLHLRITMVCFVLWSFDTQTMDPIGSGIRVVRRQPLGGIPRTLKECEIETEVLKLSIGMVVR
ncbi:hypothetical protein AAG570_013066 [Ranatra chinensis]|uniref:Uncharacterized protein n=1 Tax=Ranatra chinensis TaxID=642074 RepID=A0ABD0YFQ9_9HEMI